MKLGKRDRGPGTGDPDERGVGAARAWTVADNDRSPTRRPHDRTRVPGPRSLVPSPP